MHPKWLSNSFLVYARDNGTDQNSGVIVDTGGPAGPILKAIDENNLTVTHILNTHRHYDHVHENKLLFEATGAAVAAHSLEAPWIPECTQTLEDGEIIVSGALQLQVIHIPGHTSGQIGLSVLVEGQVVAVFTADTLFKGSIGGNRGSGHTSFEDLRNSVERLMALPPDTLILPGHCDFTTVKEERTKNPFVLGLLDAALPTPRPCVALDQPATLILEALDYDGGTKAWVRFKNSENTGENAIVPGSKVVAI